MPAIQLVFANFYLGIAEGALETASAYTRERTRPWPYGGDDKQRATEEWYVLEGYGTLQSKLWADEALLDAVGAEISAVLHAPREELTERRRGEIAVRIAAGKLRIVDDGLEVASKIYELTGARATSNAVGLDIFWRTSVRTACTIPSRTRSARWGSTCCSARCRYPPGTRETPGRGADEGPAPHSVQTGGSGDVRLRPSSTAVRAHGARA